MTEKWLTETSLRRVENRILRPISREEDKRFLRQVSQEAEKGLKSKGSMRVRAEGAADTGARTPIGTSGILLLLFSLLALPEGDEMM